MQIHGNDYQMFVEHIDKRVAQRGTAPSGRLCLGISLPTEADDASTWSRFIGVGRVALLRNAEPFKLNLPSDATLLAANIDHERFRSFAQFSLSPAQMRQVDEANVIQLPEGIAADIAVKLYGAMSRADANLGCSDDDLTDLICRAFLDVFGGESVSGGERYRSLAISTWIVRRAEEMTFERPETPPSVIELCTKLKVSRRGLQNSFQAVTGSAPADYLRNVRLNAVRRRLRGTSADAVSVGDAAAEMGFFHLSHFARHYRNLFGELPSDTCRASVFCGHRGIRQH
ncbi:helix-turn-helix domain-containing protein [Pandoraea sp. SD6-2]|uniref:helix-turn-helix domain-containing protein n=1 Tax=Pandoraea sp. SD6-2 TaxID=1286093 RepID=UPI00143CA853|nr:helix-turn-helix domain-containing protein [Pandoraea sp. SD6-2]